MHEYRPQMHSDVPAILHSVHNRFGGMLSLTNSSVEVRESISQLPCRQELLPHRQVTFHTPIRVTVHSWGANSDKKHYLSHVQWNSCDPPLASELIIYDRPLNNNTTAGDIKVEVCLCFNGPPGYLGTSGPLQYVCILYLPSNKQNTSRSSSWIRVYVLKTKNQKHFFCRQKP